MATRQVKNIQIGKRIENAEKGVTDMWDVMETSNRCALVVPAKEERIGMEAIFKNCPKQTSNHIFSKLNEP